MKHLYTLLILAIPYFCFSQNYIGGEAGENFYGFTLHNEIEPDSSFVVGGFKTVVGKESNIKLRAGVKIGNPKLHVVIYAPILNYSFVEKKYNTPFNSEVRWTINKGMFSQVKVIAGVEIYKDKTYPYLNVVVPFVLNKREYKHQSF